MPNSPEQSEPDPKRDSDDASLDAAGRISWSVMGERPSGSLDALKLRIAEGDYNIDALDVAEAMIRFFHRR